MSASDIFEMIIKNYYNVAHVQLFLMILINNIFILLQMGQKLYLLSHIE